MKQRNSSLIWYEAEKLIPHLIWSRETHPSSDMKQRNSSLNWYEAEKLIPHLIWSRETHPLSDMKQRNLSLIWYEAEKLIPQLIWSRDTHPSSDMKQRQSYVSKTTFLLTLKPLSVIIVIPKLLVNKTGVEFKENKLLAGGASDFLILLARRTVVFWVLLASRSS